jgi:Domain of unknown function (DUF4352)
MDNVPTPTTPTNTDVDPGKGLGIASLVLSLLGVHLIGLILGIVGLSKSKKVNKSNGLAVAGIIISSIGMVVAAVLLIALAIGAGKSAVEINKNVKITTSDKISTEDSTKVYKFSDRADKQAADIEVMPTEPATINGVQMTVSSVEYKTSLSEFETADSGKTYLVANVVISNTSDKTQPYSSSDFRVQTAGGQVLDPTFSASIKDELSYADLVTGGKATGKVVFLLPEETAHQYIIWKPGFDSERAVVQAK